MKKKPRYSVQLRHWGSQWVEVLTASQYGIATKAGAGLLSDGATGARVVDLVTGKSVWSVER